MLEPDKERLFGWVLTDKVCEFFCEDILYTVPLSWFSGNDLQQLAQSRMHQMDPYTHPESDYQAMQVMPSHCVSVCDHALCVAVAAGGVAQ